MAQPFFLKPGGEPQVLLTRLVSYILIEVGKPLYGQGFEVLAFLSLFCLLVKGKWGNHFPAGGSQIAGRLCLNCLHAKGKRGNHFPAGGA
eukprot:5794225-Amphidinium_carterae.1